MKVSKSRTFAVITLERGELRVHPLWRTVDETGVATLQSGHVSLGWSPALKDQLIQLLVQLGITVRFYDPEEKQWMDMSAMYGVVRAPGSRDGTWGSPNLEEFDKDYLPIV